MRLLLRWCFSGLCLLSLVACLGTAWLCWRSGRPPGITVGSVATGGARYTVRAEKHRLVRYGPPPLTPAPRGWASNALAAAEASALRNDDIAWFILRPRDARQGLAANGMRVSPLVRNPALFPLLDYTRRVPGANRALLSALEESDRFAAAHVVLALRAGALWEAPAEPGGRGVRASYDGLRLDLTPGQAHDPGSGLQYYQDAVGPWLDPSQLPFLRAQWHRRLDVADRSVRLRPAIEATAMPPLLWLALRTRRLLVLRRRRRLGLCHRCGYDLTGNTSGRCSECGEGVNAGGRATA